MDDYLKNGCSIIVNLMVKTKETQGKILSNDFVIFKGEKFLRQIVLLGIFEVVFSHDKTFYWDPLKRLWPI